MQINTTIKYDYVDYKVSLTETCTSIQNSHIMNKRNDMNNFLNILKKFVALTCNTENTNIIDSITIENCDFTETTYEREENGFILRNEESDSFIIVEYDNISGCAANFKLFDNLSNPIVAVAPHLAYSHDIVVSHFFGVLSSPR